MIPERITAIEQQAFLRGCQKFEISSDGELAITLDRFSKKRQFKIPLWQIIPDSEYLKSNQIGSFVGVIFFGSCVTITIVGMGFFIRDWPMIVILAFPLILFGAFFFVCFWTLKTQSVDAMVFHLRQGGQLHIWFEKPNPNAFYAFCENLSNKAARAWQSRPIDPPKQSLAGEIAALKKLKEQGVLSEIEFEKVKAKLIDSADERRIGF